MRYVIFLLLALPFAGTGCDSGEDTSDFFIVAMRDERPWGGTPRASVSRNDLGQPRLTFGGQVGDMREPCPAPDYCESLGLLLGPASNQTGTYPLDPSLPGTPIAIFGFFDGDQPEAQYQTPPEGGGFVRVEEFDETAQIVVGMFEAVVVNQAAPFDTLRFTDGRFRTRFEEL